MASIVSLLIILLSKPGDPVVFGVVREFKSPGECVKALRDADIPEKDKSSMMCMTVVKPLEA